MKHLISSLALILTQCAFAQSFENVSALHGIDASLTLSTQGSGVSFYDFDKDGWDDLSFAQVNAPPRFYRNNQGSFEEISLSIDDDALMKHLTWVDIDNDGDADLFYTVIFGACRLFINDGNLNFTDISSNSGFPADSTHHIDGVCWGDYDRDGFVDVYLCHFNDQYYPHQYTNWLMRNLGDGTFENVTETAGVSNGDARSFQASFLDFDGDLWPDIHVINDRPMYADALYRNLGDGTFEDVSISSNTDLSIDAMSSSCADYDNDEDLDIYVTNLPAGNVLLNNNQGVFSDSTSSAGLEVFGVCWAANWADFDNDGWQDLYVCTMDAGDTESYNHAYKNNGSDVFTNIGFGSFPDDEFQSWSNVCGDINNDGFVDLASSSMSPQLPPLWLNEASASNNFVKIGLEGTASNRDGIGSWIKVFTNDMIQSRYTACGEDYLCQDSQREIIGLGQAEMIDSLTVRWPSGHEDAWYNIPANQTLQLVEGASLDAQISIDGPLEFCEGEQIQLSGPDGYIYSWISGQSTQSIDVSESGEYQLVITNEWGVSASSEPVIIVVHELQIWYYDQDGDGYGHSSNSLIDCLAPANYAALDGDCDDIDATVYPGAAGMGIGIDNNCNGIIDQPESTCPGDFNGDASIDVSDLLVFLTGYGCLADCPTDLDGDNIASTSDLIQFLAFFGINCGP